MLAVARLNAARLCGIPETRLVDPRHLRGQTLPLLRRLVTRLALAFTGAVAASSVRAEVGRALGGGVAAFTLGELGDTSRALTEGRRGAIQVGLARGAASVPVAAVVAAGSLVSDARAVAVAKVLTLLAAVGTPKRGASAIGIGPRLHRRASTARRRGIRSVAGVAGIGTRGRTTHALRTMPRLTIRIDVALRAAVSTP